MKRIYVFIGLFALLSGTGMTRNGQAQELRFQYQEEAAGASKSIDELFDLTRITELKTNIYDSSNKQPENRFAKVETGEFEGRSFDPQAILWEAPDIRHNPLYFEDIGLERYGQDAGLLQPVMSGVHFFGGVHNLPLHAMVKPPFSCDYPLGHYRPGNCVPYLHYSFPW